MNLLQTISEYLSYSFVRYALITGVMIASCASLLGVTLVLKRFSFMGDGLSHTAFGALAVASVLRLTNTMYFVLPVTILCAVILLCAGEKLKLKGDSSVAMISTGALAFGYLIMNIFSPPSNLSGDVCTTLFGSTLILTLKKGEVILSIVLSFLVILFYVIFYHKIFAVTFDESFAKCAGIRTKLYNLLLSVIVAVIIVLAMNLVGSLLISALIVFPAVSALSIFKSYLSVTVSACIFSVICAFVGILTAVLSGTPVGSTIVIADIICFAVCKIISFRR